VYKRQVLYNQVGPDYGVTRIVLSFDRMAETYLLL
jgi:hypothetical protein